MNALAAAGVVAEVLPIAMEYLGMETLTPGRALVDSGVDVAVATDFNPGSAMCSDLQLAVRLAVVRCGLSCEEALLGITKNAAKALGREDIGEIKVGAKADLCILDTDCVWDLFYDWSISPIQAVVKNGRLASSRA